MKTILSLFVGLILAVTLCACNSDKVYIKGKRDDIISEENNNTEWKTLYLQQLMNVDEIIFEGFSLIYVDNDNIHAGNIVKDICVKCKGNGGGNKMFAQGGGSNADNITDYLKEVKELLKKA